jgi:thiol-disulfide isomerase/thioredoxin
VSRLHWASIAVAAAVALAGGIAIGLEHRAAGKRAIETLYATSLPDLDSHPQSFSQWKNKTLLINYWATWCAPCLEEIPALIRIQSRYSSKNLQIVGIALDSPDKVQGFAKSYGINYPLFIGGMGMMDLMHAQGNDVGALPFTLVVSPGGTATQTHLGALSEQQMESMIAEAQATPGS